MYVPVVVVGAGHAGLTMSQRLTERSIDHVVLERGEVAHSWRTQRWDSLRLLTPNWHVRLPGATPVADDPDGFMTAAQTAGFIERYARAIAAPVLGNTAVTALRRHGDRFTVETDGGTWTCDAVVIASGGNVVAGVPPLASALPASIASITTLDYRNPSSLPDGGVLVVGASASGVQLAAELRAADRPVTLAVGEHVRMPRIYRGRDVFWWTERAGILDQRYDEVDDLVRARHVPSPQLVGSTDRRTIGLNELRAAGVRLVGRLGRLSGPVASFAGSLANVCTLADLKLTRLLQGFDDAAASHGFADDVGPVERFAPTVPPASPVGELDLVADGITTVLWATGCRPDHRWVDLPVFDHRGRIRHDGGVVAGADGLYVLGLNLLRRRRSSYLAGAAADTADLADHLHRHLDTTARAALASSV